MRSRMSALVLSLIFVLAFAGCNKKESQNQPATDTTSSASPQANQMTPTTPAPTQNQAGSTTPPAGQSQMANSAPPPQMAPAPAPAPPPPPPPPIVVPAGANLVVRMGNTIDTKTANAGDTFTGTLAHSVAVHGEVAIPAGASVVGTVINSKSPGKFKGEGTLSVALTSIAVNRVPVDIQTSTYTQTIKGKGKRSAAMTGGGAGGGALIGGLAGGGKGALIGGLVGAGAGAAGATFTGNKDLQIPAESAITFKLSTPITVKRSPRKSQGDQGSASQ